MKTCKALVQEKTNEKKKRKKETELSPGIASQIIRERKPVSVRSAGIIVYLLGEIIKLTTVQNKFPIV